MTQAAKAQEPSMEEILASIRRIIADDDATKSPAKAPEPAKAAAAPAAPARPAPPPPPRPAAAAAPKPAPPPPAPEVSGQDDIDAMFDSVEPEPKSNGAAPPESNDILELTEAMEAPPEPPPALRRIDSTPDVVYDEAPPARTPTVEEARRQFHEQTAPERSLLSSSTTAAVDSAFNSLAHTVLVQNSRTLDDLVREMLRPMLKAWLDDNLPNMVERMVRAEIERVSRGRG
jgi:cell pole-organizing protein PopZ